MHKRDLDKNISSGSSRVGSSRSRKTSSSPSGSYGGSSSDERMRNMDESEIDTSESGEDLQRKQREGNLGNERVRSSPRERTRGTK
jgi:hypothetical protein